MALHLISERPFPPPSPTDHMVYPVPAAINGSSTRDGDSYLISASSPSDNIDHSYPEEVRGGKLTS